MRPADRVGGDAGVEDGGGGQQGVQSAGLVGQVLERTVVVKDDRGFSDVCEISESVALTVHTSEPETHSPPK